jgi:ketosteroid isomerase-like protein
MTGPGKATIETLQRLVDAFNAHDLDAVMSFFVDDPVLEIPRGPDPWGQRFQGREVVRSGLASRFAGLPDVHYGEDRHWVSGDRGCSEWLVTGTTTPGTGSRSAGATCSSSRTTRSPGRTRTGSSSSGETLLGRPPRLPADRGIGFAVSKRRSTGDRHHHPRRQAPIPRLRGPGRVRTRPDPRNAPPPGGRPLVTTIARVRVGVLAGL